MPSMLKTFQLVLVALTAYALGLYTAKFMDSGWDWTNVVGCLGAGAICVVNLFLLIRDFWKPNG